ncbi:MAG: toll/interleukin-1 receptor domain-containing protein [Candidatus Sulfotelmatobacter sp.]
MTEVIPYSVFVSHSTKQDDLAIINAACNDALLRGITCYIAERDWQFGKPLPEKIDKAIRSCDCFVVFLTQGGTQSAWVHQEIGFARACGKLRIMVVEHGVKVQGFDVDKEYIHLDRSDPSDAITKLNTYLSGLQLAKAAALRNGALLVLSILGLLLLKGGE